MKHIKRNSLVIALLLLAGPPIAATAADSGFDSDSSLYLGGGIGYGRMNGEDYTNTSGDLTKRRVSWKGLAGMSLSRMVAIEGQYIDFGASNRNTDRIQATGWTAGVVLDVPLRGSITPYGKIGALFWETDNQFNNISRNEDGIDMSLGLGVRFQLSPYLALRTEYERFEMDRTEIDNLSVNVQVNF